jgi:uncharacterized protein YndB with AHSA1/START domain
MTDDHGTFRQQLRIEAPLESVFSYFTDPARMARWMGIDHKLDPTVDGLAVMKTIHHVGDIDAARSVVWSGRQAVRSIVVKSTKGRQSWDQPA